MCGITAVWGESDKALTKSMMQSLVHRGPDGQGVGAWEKGSLGHRRLAIIDPAGGKQPLYNEDQRLGLVANGEIYNFAELKDRLIRRRHRFATASDSEVAVHLYEEHGEDELSCLDGMYAYALTDGIDFMAVRDPVGIKPLYYGKRGESLVFASELKALAGRVTEVKEFPPGSFYHSRSGLRKYRSLPRARPAAAMTPAQACRQVRRTLEEAIDKRLMSDVPLGAFLSGGLDSSIIAAVARSRMKELHTFAVGIEGSRDLQAARMVAEHIGSIHHEHVFTVREIQENLPDIVYSLESFDLDLVRSAIPCHFVSRLAAGHVKVILTGEGADELFGGYAYYKDFDDTMPLHEELYRSVCSLHNVNLQRVDRLTMAHSIEGRVPFLDLAMIKLGQRIPTHLKIRRDQRSGKRIEKWVLRKAFEDLLPPEIAWRDKEQFDEGSGSADVLPHIGEHFMPAAEFAGYAARHHRDHLRSHEEGVYHKLLCGGYPDAEAILANVGRWQQGRLGGLPA